MWPNGTVTVHLGNGDGTFTPAASPTTGQQAQSIAVGDFNGDGTLDMAIVNGQSDTLTMCWETVTGHSQRRQVQLQATAPVGSPR